MDYSNTKEIRKYKIIFLLPIHESQAEARVYNFSAKDIIKACEKTEKKRKTDERTVCIIQIFEIRYYAEELRKLINQNLSWSEKQIRYKAFFWYNIKNDFEDIRAKDIDAADITKACEIAQKDLLINESVVAIIEYSEDGFHRALIKKIINDILERC